MLIQANVRRLPLSSNSVDLIFTDPPYLHKYLHCYQWLAQEAKRVLKPQGFVLAMCGGLYLNQIFRFFDDAGLTFYWKYEMFMEGLELARVFPRGNPTISVQVRTKSILAYSKGQALPPSSTVSMVKSGGRDKRFHEWGQGVTSARYCIAMFSRRGELVLDPFIGGGTTAIACEQIDRKWICGDLDPTALATTAKRLKEK